MSEFLLDDFNDWVRGVGWAVAISLEVEVALIVRLFGPPDPECVKKGRSRTPDPNVFSSSLSIVFGGMSGTYNYKKGISFSSFLSSKQMVEGLVPIKKTRFRS